MPIGAAYSIGLLCARRGAAALSRSPLAEMNAARGSATVPAVNPEQPSQTAMLAAGARALHTLRHGPAALLQDWLAWPLMGSVADELLPLGKALLGQETDAFTTWIAARSRFSDDWLKSCSATQHVILGAGLDSSAWRSPGDVRVFEVDHPATQAWKRARVEMLELRWGDPVWVAVDFERQGIHDALVSSGLEDDARVFVSWHGVVPYLTADAVTATLSELPAQASIALSYVVPESDWSERAHPIASTFQGLAADAGEPWLSLMTPDDVRELLSQVGFAVAEDVGPDDVADRYGLPAMNYERIALAHRSS